MYDAWKIIIGMVLFVFLMAFPIFYATGKKAPVPEPKIDTPEILALPENERKCVEPKEFMKTEHMVLLDKWRNSFVRDGMRFYVATDGREHLISLTNTCMRCHSNKEEFCDACHNYVAVKPYCWDCHIEPGRLGT